MNHALHLTIQGPSLGVPVIASVSSDAATLGASAECEVHLPLPGIAPLLLTFMRVGADFAVRAELEGAKLDGRPLRPGAPIVLRSGMTVEVPGASIGCQLSAPDTHEHDRFTIADSSTAILEMALVGERMGDPEVATLGVTAGLARGVALRLGDDRSTWRVGGIQADLTLAPNLSDDALTLTRRPDERIAVTPGDSVHVTLNAQALTSTQILRSGDTLSLAGNALLFEDPLEGVLDALGLGTHDTPDLEAPPPAGAPQPDPTPAESPPPEPTTEPITEPAPELATPAARDPDPQGTPHTPAPQSEKTPKRGFGVFEVGVILVSVACMAAGVYILLVVFELL